MDEVAKALLAPSNLDFDSFDDWTHEDPTLILNTTTGYGRYDDIRTTRVSFNNEIYDIYLCKVAR